MDDEYVKELRREADPRIVEWALKYAPFALSLRVNTSTKHQCDFCGYQKAKRIVRVFSPSKRNSLYCCFVCDTLKRLVPKEEIDRLHKEVFVTTESLCSDAHLVEEKTEADMLEYLFTKGSDKVAKIVEEAQQNQKAGKGKGWRIVPDLICQYKKRHSLTPKQTAVLKKYNQCCLTER